MDPARIDQAVSEFEEEQLPTIKELDGFRGFTLIIDRSSGKAVGTSYWSTPEQMQASEEAGTSARQRVAETSGATAEPEVERFEVALDTFVG
jgi:heme-degrading monooxygenase HmoA